MFSFNTCSNNGLLMAKTKRSLLKLLKRWFSSETHTKSDKEKRRRWMFGRLKTKKYPSLAAPSPIRDGTLGKAEEEQSKHAINNAIATVVVAAEVARLTSFSKAMDQCTEYVGERKDEPPGSFHQDMKEFEDIAATKIQTAFRGFLARKALRALRGIVKLQAIIRGQVVRGQTMTTLRSLQSIINIQSRLTARRNLMNERTRDLDESKRFRDLNERLIKIECSSRPGRWDERLMSKEDMESVYLDKIGAAIRRERIKEYSSIHRKSADSERKRRTGRYWLEQWVDNQLAKSKEMEDLDSYVYPYRRYSEEYSENLPKVRSFHRQTQTEAVNSPSSAQSTLRKLKQCSATDGMPVIPTYMAATESTMAKARSTSTPRLRSGSFDTYSECHSPHKNKVALTTSIRNEVPSSRGRVSRTCSYQKRSPSLKSIPSPVKSCHS